MKDYRTIDPEDLSEDQLQELVDDVIEQMKDDIKDEDWTAIDELLKSCPVENLISYLPEEL